MKDIEQRQSGAREALLTAATRLFTEKGYAAVGTREIADAARVNLGAIQYHFGSKAQLFLATVRSLMEECSCDNAGFSNGEVTTREEAAEALVTFIEEYLDYLLNPKGPAPCRLMFREIFSDTSREPELYEALVSSAVADFIAPVDILLRKIVAPFFIERPSSEVEFAVQSILGQCSFYVSHRPFIERLRRCDLSDDRLFAELVTHLSRFTLRGLRCEEALIDKVLAARAVTIETCPVSRPMQTAAESV